MARKIRIEYAEAAYHVMARGSQGRDIYADERDRKLWLETLGEACEKTEGLRGAHGRRVLELGLKWGRKELAEEWKAIRRGWCVGGTELQAIGRLKRKRRLEQAYENHNGKVRVRMCEFRD